MEKEDVIEKKEWFKPTFKKLDFNKTLGGATQDTGEDTFVDVTS